MKKIILKNSMTSIFKTQKPYIIAEAGVNHNGNFLIAKKLIKLASNCGANAVKFQIFSANDLSSINTPLAAYQKKNLTKNISQHQMLKNLELRYEDYLKLKKYSKKLKIDFFVSIFDEKSLNFAEKKLKSKIIKIPSGEITNFFLLKKINLKKYKIILSTGMSNLKEIAESLNLISKKKIFLFTKNKIKIVDYKLHSYLKKRVSLLHCVTDYPVDQKYLNLNSIETILKEFLLPTGFSDHTQGSLASCLALAKGAVIIEKHFTLDNSMAGPDHTTSLNPLEFKKFVANLKKSSVMLGNYKKKIQYCEKKNVKVVRKSIVASKFIKKNQIFTLKNLCSKRAGPGISPMKLKKLLNKKAKRNYKADELIKFI